MPRQPEARRGAWFRTIRASLGPCEQGRRDLSDLHPMIPEKAQMRGRPATATESMESDRLLHPFRVRDGAAATAVMADGQRIAGFERGGGTHDDHAQPTPR